MPQNQNEAGPLMTAGKPAQGPVTDPNAAPAQEEAETVGGEAPGSQEASREDQDAYDRFAMAGLKILYEDKKASSAVVKKLKIDSKEPAKALADTVAMIIVQLDQQSGGKMPEDIILPVATELLEQTAELADSLKLFPVDEAVLNHAGQLMVTILGEEYGADQEEIASYMESLDPEYVRQIGETQGNFANKQPPSEVL